jgi:hypothetical protein
MSAIQALRAKALAAGNLKSGSQIVVAQQSPQVIVIQPTNPQVVYAVAAPGVGAISAKAELKGCLYVRF